MKPGDQYHKWIEWSDEDQLYLAWCPDLFSCFHDSDNNLETLYLELLLNLEDCVDYHLKEGDPLPEPLVRPVTGKRMPRTDGPKNPPCPVDRYHLWVEWDEKAAVYRGLCPDLDVSVQGADETRLYPKLRCEAQAKLDALEKAAEPLPPVQTRPNAKWINEVTRLQKASQSAAA